MKTKSFKPEEAFDKQLTDAERAAPTFLEWPDATLATSVRVLAKDLHDGFGFDGITGLAAALALDKIVRASKSTNSCFRLDNGTTITVKIGRKS